MTTELFALAFLGETWTYLDQSGSPHTITWDEKLKRLSERKDAFIAKKLDDEQAHTLATLIKAGAPDRTLMEFLGAGTYSLCVAFRYLKSINLLPQNMRNRWAKKPRRRKKHVDKRLITCSQLGG